MMIDTEEQSQIYRKNTAQKIAQDNLRIIIPSLSEIFLLFLFHIFGQTHLF